MARLVPLSSPDGGGVEIGTGLTIGRRETCQIRISGQTVSAVQCEVQWEAQLGAYQVIDKSSNGTFINGKLMEKEQVSKLNDGDVVQFTKRWPQSTGLQYRFVLPKSGLPEPALSAAEGDAKAKPCVADDSVARLQQSLREVQDRAASLTRELAALQQQLAQGVSCDAETKDVVTRDNLQLKQDALQRLQDDRDAAIFTKNNTEEEKQSLERQVGAALEDAAAAEGVRSANHEMVQEQEERHQRLQRDLQLLLGARQSIRQSTSKFKKDADEARAVELHLQKLATDKTCNMKKLQLQLQSSVSDIHIHSTSLSQTITEPTEPEPEEPEEPDPPEKLPAESRGRSKRTRPEASEIEKCSGAPRISRVRKSLEAGDIPTMEIL